MFLFKLGLLTCAFYVVLTLLLEAGLWAMIRFGSGVSVFFSSKHWFWGGGLAFGVIFGTLWIISFSVAWYVVYQDLKRYLPISAN
jgi:hypothetical protein